MINILGIAGTIFATIMYMPQAAKVYSTKQTQGLSKISFSIIIFGGFCWIFYSALAQDLLPWLTNILIGTMMFVIIWYLYGEKKSLKIIIPLFILEIVSILFMFVYNVHPDAWVKTLLSTMAGIGTGCGLYIQLYKTIKTQDTNDISIMMLVLITINQIIWLARWTLMYVETPNADYIACIIFSVLPIISAVGLIGCKLLIKNN